MQVKIGNNVYQRCRDAWLLLFLTFALSAGCASNKAIVADGLANRHETGERIVESLGINIHGLVLSSAGYMLDLRYRVTDADKAAPLMDKKVKPYLIAEASGARLDIPDTPKIGRLRQLPRNNGVVKERDYFIIFANPGHRLQTGDKVHLYVGETRIENLSIH